MAYFDRVSSPDTYSDLFSRRQAVQVPQMFGNESRATPGQMKQHQPGYIDWNKLNQFINPQPYNFDSNTGLHQFTNDPPTGGPGPVMGFEPWLGGGGNVPGYQNPWGEYGTHEAFIRANPPGSPGNRGYGITDPGFGTNPFQQGPVTLEPPKQNQPGALTTYQSGLSNTSTDVVSSPRFTVGGKAVEVDLQNELGETYAWAKPRY